MSSPKPSPDAVQSNDTSSKGRNPRGRRNGLPRGASKFEGENSELKGHVYDCVGSKQADLYVKTTKHIADYFSSTTTNAGDFRNAILTLQLPTVANLTRPTPRADGTYDEMDKLEYTERYRKRKKKLSEIEELNKTLYPVIWAQCSDTMREKLKRAATYQQFSVQADGISLLQAIKSISHNVLDINYPVDTIHDALHNLITCKQATYMSVENYHEQFTNRRDTYILTGGHDVASPGVLRMIAQMNNVAAVCRSYKRATYRGI